MPGEVSSRLPTSVTHSQTQPQSRPPTIPIRPIKKAGRRPPPRPPLRSIQDGGGSLAPSPEPLPILINTMPAKEQTGGELRSPTPPPSQKPLAKYSLIYTTLCVTHHPGLSVTHHRIEPRKTTAY
jgi:hypothetical protein